MKVKVEKYRGDTWLDVSDGKKLKVSFEYDESEELGNITIAITNIIGESALTWTNCVYFIVLHEKKVITLNNLARALK